MEYHDFAFIYDELMQDVPYERWVDFILQKAQISDEALVVDAACGTGNATLVFSRRGYKTVGVDISEQMLQVACSKTVNARVKPVFVKQNISQLEIHKKADLITCICDGVNYLLKDSEVLSFFTAVYNLLNEDGIFAFDISSEYKIKNILAQQLFYEDNDYITYFWKNSFNEQKSILKMELTFFVKDSEDEAFYKRFEEIHYQRAYSEEKLKNMLVACGFKSIETYDNYSEKNTNNKSERITFVVKK